MFPITFLNMACPVNALEKPSDNNSSQNAAHIFCSVTKESLNVWQGDGNNYNNIIVIGY